MKVICDTRPGKDFAGATHIGALHAGRGSVGAA
jgi:hypothetical protein